MSIKSQFDVQLRLGCVERHSFFCMQKERKGDSQSDDDHFGSPEPASQQLVVH
jgi:hypothetical protein